MPKSNSAKNPGLELRQAAAKGDVDHVTTLLNKKFINETSSNGNTALHWSIENQHYAVTKRLLTTTGIKVAIANRQGQTPLHLAVDLGDKKTVLRLLKFGFDYTNSRDNQGLSLLDYACKKGDNFIVSKLKNRFPKMTFKDEDAQAEAAYEKFQKNNPTLVNSSTFDFSYLFNAKDVAPYFQPGNKYSLADIKKAVAVKKLDLHKLFVCGNLLQSAAVSRIDTLEKLSWLLEQGVDPNQQACHELNPSFYKNTALHTLIANEDEEHSLALIDLLLSPKNKKFNFNLTDSEGKTCLCLAVKVGLVEVALKLISLKDSVDVNISDEDGNTPLHYAFLLGHVSIAKELLNAGSLNDLKNNAGQTPYELLISSGIEDIRDCLETIWINPDRRIENSKKTYIQQCMENRQRIPSEYKTDLKQILVLDQEKNIEQKKKSINFLLAAQTGNLTQLKENCDTITLNACNSRGDTALHLAYEHRHNEIISFLLAQSGIDLTKKNNKNIAVATRLSQSFFVPTSFKEKFSLNTEDTTEALKDNPCGASKLA